MSTREPLVAPSLLPSEIANIIRQRVRKGLLTSDAAQTLFGEFMVLPIRFIQSGDSHAEALRLANRYDLDAVYDAYYVAVAQQLNANLWTADQHLLRHLHGKLTGVPWIGEYVSG